MANNDDVSDELIGGGGGRGRTEATKVGMTSWFDAVTRATTRAYTLEFSVQGISFAEGIKINENCSGHNSSSGDINATAGRERIRGAARNAADKEEMKREGREKEREREREREEPRDVFADENRYRETPTPTAEELY